jgi:hypothetical protein
MFVLLRTNIIASWHAHRECTAVRVEVLCSGKRRHDISHLSAHHVLYPALHQYYQSSVSIVQCEEGTSGMNSKKLILNLL